MKATFTDFIEENRNCSKFENNRDAMDIFALLSDDDNIIRMIDMSDMEKPALAACVNCVETHFDRQTNPTIDLKDEFTRTAVGRMIKTILKPFGYEVTIQKSLPKATRGRYFSSASCYAKTGTASMKVIRTIVEV
ncbi:MAG: hypothetical protein PHP40_06725 [Eubacteriales bacterium]|nr:hypothetical protein [Eubacteriales bacterium]MDD3931984.1 hypothetical protein [Eubacteriales bacterium]